MKHLDKIQLNDFQLEGLLSGEEKRSYAFIMETNVFCTNIMKGKMKVILQSVITCPECGYTKEETMPADACAYFYACESCRQVLKPKPGDCCVYCSYGTVKCPPVQEGTGCCG